MRRETYMLRPRFVVFSFLFISVLAIGSSFLYSQKKHPYRLAICAMFKNEGPWLQEWIAYHHKVLGVERFYLYNNDSTDNSIDILQPFIDKGIVELIDWNSADTTHRIDGVMDLVWMPYQLGAYNDCLKNRALGKAKWVAMIDIDEFIVPTHGVPSFYHYLQRMEKRRKGTIKLFWKVFGTSHVWDLAPGELLVEKLTQRGEDSHPWHQLAKSLYRPEAVEFCSIHDNPKLKPGFRRASADAKAFCIHHYWTRTEKACRAKRSMSTDEYPPFFLDTNRVTDTTMHQYVPTLKKVLAKLEH